MYVAAKSISINTIEKYIEKYWRSIFSSIKVITQILLPVLFEVLVTSTLLGVSRKKYIHKHKKHK